MSIQKIITGLLFIVVITILSCNSEQEQSPFADVLSQQPYTGITDSIRKEPNRDDLYFRRAILLNKNNLPEPALSDFQKAWSISRQETYAVGISNILLDKNKNEAAAFIVEALKELPQSIFLKLTLTRLYSDDNEIEKALAICISILEQQPDQVNALLLKAELLQKKNDNTEATNVLETAYHLVPENLDVAYKLAYQYAENKNDKTIALADSLIAKDSLKMHAEPYYIKGLYYSNTNQKAKAITLFDQTIKTEYNYLNAYIEKGKALLDLKKNKEALQVFQLANTISPSFPDAYFWIGKCQELNGEKEDAKLSYKKAFSLDKSFTEAKEAADAIK